MNGYGFLQKVRSWTKVSIENGEEVAPSSSKGPSEVSSLLEPGTVLPADVVEAALCCQCMNGVRASVVQDIDLQLMFRVLELLDVFIRVFQDLNGLFAARQIYIDRRSRNCIDSMFLEDLLVLLNIIVLATDAHRVRDDKIHLQKEDDGTKPVKGVKADDKKPHANGQAQKGEHTECVESKAVRLEVQHLLVVGWSGG